MIRQLLRPVCWFSLFVLAGLLTACVDPYAPDFRATVNVVVVDGIINNLAEAQIIRLNRSRADPLTGRFGTLPITKASVEVVVDSAQVIACHETEDGSYQLPNEFRGRVGHAYQLRFTLSDGTQYASNQQVMPAVPPIRKLEPRFNPNSLSPPLQGFYTAGHDVFIDFADPAQTRNYYRWDWRLWEKQAWCRTCLQGIYSVNRVTAELMMNYSFPPGNFYIYRSDNTALLEDCYKELTPPPPSFRNPVPEYKYDYNCRTQCWEILSSYTLNLFDDQFSNGGLITGRKVAQIPFYTTNPALVEIRQGALTADAYSYFSLLKQQTQNTGGLADTPPMALVGNVQNRANSTEAVVGYFTASAVATARLWLDRKDTQGIALGNTEPDKDPSLLDYQLFFALNARRPIPEPRYPEAPQLQLFNSPPRPPTAICTPSDSKTPYKPEGWRE